jgi:hypothetical protein
MKSKNNKHYIWPILILLGVIAVAVGFFIPSGEGEHGFYGSNINSFYAALGFVGCVAIIYIAKWLGHYWLQRKEDYYD